MQRVESTLNVSEGVGQKEAIGVECRRRLDILAESTMGEEAEEERGWKEEGVLDLTLRSMALAAAPLQVTTKSKV